MGQNVDTFLKDKNEGKGIFFCYFFIFFFNNFNDISL